MKNLLTILLMSLFSSSTSPSKELDFSFRINTKEKLLVQPVIEGDPLINVEAVVMKIVEEGQYRRYNAKISFSRDPSEQEMKNFRIAILKEPGDDPLFFGTTYAVFEGKRLTEDLLSINIHREIIEIPRRYLPGERLVYSVNSGDLYESNNVGFADDAGKFAIPCEVTSKKSTLKIVVYDDLLKSRISKIIPKWEKWEIELGEGAKLLTLSSVKEGD